MVTPAGADRLAVAAESEERRARCTFVVAGVGSTGTEIVAQGQLMSTRLAQRSGGCRTSRRGCCLIWIRACRRPLTGCWGAGRSTRPRAACPDAPGHLRRGVYGSTVKPPPVQETAPDHLFSGRSHDGLPLERSCPPICPPTA